MPHDPPTNHHDPAVLRRLGRLRPIGINRPMRRRAPVFVHMASLTGKGHLHIKEKGGINFDILFPVLPCRKSREPAAVGAVGPHFEKGHARISARIFLLQGLPQGPVVMEEQAISFCLEDGRCCQCRGRIWRRRSSGGKIGADGGLKVIVSGGIAKGRHKRQKPQTGGPARLFEFCGDPARVKRRPERRPQPSRCIRLRASLRARRMASAFWRARFSDGFS